MELPILTRSVAASCNSVAYKAVLPEADGLSPYGSRYLAMLGYLCPATQMRDSSRGHKYRTILCVNYATRSVNMFWLCGWLHPLPYELRRPGYGSAGFRNRQSCRSWRVLRYVAESCPSTFLIAPYSLAVE